MSATTKFPPIEWFQLRDCVNLSVRVSDAEDVKLEIESEGETSVLKLSLRSSTGDKPEYACQLKLFAPVEPALSSHEVKARAVHLKLMKKKSAGEWFWPRLTFEKIKNNNIKIDFEKWKEEEELTNSYSSGSGSGSGGAGAGGGGLDFEKALAELKAGGGDEEVLNGDEIQKTLAAIRHEQQQIRQEEQLLMEPGAGEVMKTMNHGERKKRIQELSEEIAFEKKLTENVPKFGSAAYQLKPGWKDPAMAEVEGEEKEGAQQVEQKEGGRKEKKKAEGSDDDDELPPLV